MSPILPSAALSLNATGSGIHVPKYPPDQLQHVESQRFKARSPYWDKNQGDDDGFFSYIDETLPPFDHRELNYEPLLKPHWIRVLKLEPGVLYSSIKCSLIHVNLDDAEHQEYEAISYTWGQYYDNTSYAYSEAGYKAGSSALLICNGVWVTVTISLYHALQLFRRTDRPRYLWADALCINQGHADEKTHQVNMMQLIYKKAREVLIWVGWRDPHTIENTMHRLCYLVNQECSDAVKESRADRALWYDDGGAMEKPRISARPASVSSFYSSDEEPIDPNKEKVPLEPTTLMPLVALFEARYFSRLWVFQEIALSPLATMFWGRARVTFEWVALVADLIERRHMTEFASFDDASAGLRNCANMYNTWKGAYANDSFFDLLLATRGLKAQVPVDKVFGLLGITTRDSEPQDGKGFVEVDYKAGKYEVFKRVAEKVLLQAQDVRCLAAVNCADGGWKEGQASWVPDFAALGEVFLPALNAHAHGDTLPRVIKSVKCGVQACLSFDGIQVDTAAQVIDPSFAPTSHWRSINTLHALQTLIAALQPTYPDETIALCLTAGIPSLTSAFDSTSKASFLRSFTNWHPSSQPDANTDQAQQAMSPLPETYDAEMKAAYYFFLASAKAMQGKCLFRTKEGRLGVGLRGVRVGDVVVVLFGGNVPFVVRGPDGEGHWRLVGQSFVCGLMEGEGVVSWRASGKEVGEFHIF